MALQCLAVQGVVRPEVVDCLLSHANQSQSPSRRDKARELLARLSKTTVSGHMYVRIYVRMSLSGLLTLLVLSTLVYLGSAGPYAMYYVHP